MISNEGFSIVTSSSASAVSKASLGIIPAERIDSKILLIRGQKVLLDEHLAQLYEVPTRVLNQAVRRNRARFPEDFMFQLTEKETEALLRSQIVISSEETSGKRLSKSELLRSQIVTSKRGSGAGGRRYLPYAFSEQGVAMLSSVLRSPRAVQVNIEIMRAFVRLRQMIASHTDLARKLNTLEKKYDEQFKMVFDAIRELMTPVDEDDESVREIGFHTAIKASPKKT